MAERSFFRESAKPQRSAKELEKLEAALQSRGADRENEAALMQLADTGKKPERKMAYHALAEAGSAAAVRRLLEELGFADEEAVCEALKRFGPELAAEPLVTFAEQKWKQYENLSITLGLAFEGVLTACACSDPDTLEPEVLKRLLAVARKAAEIEPEPDDPNNPYAYIEAELEIRRVNLSARGILQEARERRTRP
ncbi:hypothetical protein QWJ34_06095 [Saccharibacillus sp. CPCC 101409]|uniref:hypothetical protein n=1 Tax=Saccharibacillus sp. CPCC 101409 TaxID=3058041 RepID=UPI002673C70C|nr:hypothetical protein [Saccharibacillus sp. CPCC 101409]MDO3409326.1 hypothetical protein [Saccharibacillus sp. CPCC 101409]